MPVNGHFFWNGLQTSFRANDGTCVDATAYSTCILRLYEHELFVQQFV
jgi:hypothetical protein